MATYCNLTIKPDILPAELVEFLNLVISEKTTGVNEKTERLVLSIGQDLCHVVTRADFLNTFFCV